MFYFWLTKHRPQFGRHHHLINISILQNNWLFTKKKLKFEYCINYIIPCPLFCCTSAKNSSCLHGNVRMKYEMKWNIVLEGLEGSIGFWSDDVTVRLRFRRRWCQWILESFISFGSFFLLLTQPMKSTLPLFLSLCQSVSLSLSFVSLFAFTMVSLSHVFRYVQTQLRTQHTGRQSKAPCGDRSNKNGCSNIQVYPE